MRLHRIATCIAFASFALAAAGVHAADSGTVAAARETLQAACALESRSADALSEALGGVATTLESDHEDERRGARERQWRIELPEHRQARLTEMSLAGTPARFVLDIYAPPEDGAPPAPRLSVVADGRCRVMGGREIVYDSAGRRSSLVTLEADLESRLDRRPLNPPVPPGEDPGGVTVALVDSGVNYLLPRIATRLARAADGESLGFDYWDMDDRPFDGHPSRSPFLPIPHGTGVASVLLREAPDTRLLPYRYPRPELRRLADLVADADAKGVVIVAMPMGSDDEEEWQPFLEAAAARPHMLFILSAGNDGRDIDETPVFPAAGGLENALVVTSCDEAGRLPRSSNRGASTVDLMLPAEAVPIVDFNGRERKAAGSSYAVPRLAALAARLLARHPDWRAPELKRAILHLAEPAPGEPEVRHGWLPDPGAG